VATYVVWAIEALQRDTLDALGATRLRLVAEWIIQGENKNVMLRGKLRNVWSVVSCPTASFVVGEEIGVMLKL
jgi:hypothetical protein